MGAAVCATQIVSATPFSSHFSPALSGRQSSTNYFRMSPSLGLQFFINYISLYPSPLCAIPWEPAAPVWNPHRVTCPARKSFLHKSIGPCQDLLPAWASEHENILYSCQLICSHSFVGSQYCFSHSLGFHYCVSL